MLFLALLFQRPAHVCARYSGCRSRATAARYSVFDRHANAASIWTSMHDKALIGCLVQWYDSRLGCERSRVQFPEQPMPLPPPPRCRCCQMGCALWLNTRGSYLTPYFSFYCWCPGHCWQQQSWRKGMGNGTGGVEWTPPAPDFMTSIGAQYGSRVQEQQKKNTAKSTEV